MDGGTDVLMRDIYALRHLVRILYVQRYSVTGGLEAFQALAEDVKRRADEGTAPGADAVSADHASQSAYEVLSAMLADIERDLLARQ